MTTWIPILNGAGFVESSNGLEGHLFISRGANMDKGPEENTWERIDVTQFGLPPDTKCVSLSGLLVITMGNAPGWQAIAVAVRSPSQVEATIKENYCMQAVAGTGDGVRSTASTIIALEDGAFEWGWYTSGVGIGWPEKAAIACNLTITLGLR